MNIEFKNTVRLPTKHIGEAGVMFIVLLLIIGATGVVMRMLQYYEAAGSENMGQTIAVTHAINEQIDLLTKRKSFIGSIEEEALARLEQSDFSAESDETDETDSDSVQDGALVLTGVIWSETEPLVVIGGTLYGKGDSIGGEKIVSIDKDSIVLKGEDGERRIGLYDAMEDFTIDDDGGGDG